MSPSLFKDLCVVQANAIVIETGFFPTIQYACSLQGYIA